MIEIHDELGDIPVTVDHGDDDGDDEATTHVNVGIHRPDGSYVSASANTVGETTPDHVARLVLQAALGAAAAHGTDTWIALQALVSTGSST